jgi:hypothetical protein
MLIIMPWHQGLANELRETEVWGKARRILRGTRTQIEHQKQPSASQASHVSNSIGIQEDAMQLACLKLQPLALVTIFKNKNTAPFGSHNSHN